MTIFTIALYRFKTIFRGQILRSIVVLSFLVILSSKALACISMGQDLKIIADFSLAAIDIFGMIFCLLIASRLDKGKNISTFYPILVGPLPRWQYILGEYLGFAATLTSSITTIGSLFLLFFWLNGGQIIGLMIAAIFMLWWGCLLLGAISLFFSVLTSPITSAIFTLALFIYGRASFELKYLASQCSGVLKKFLVLLYYTAPNFSYFDIKSAAVHNSYKAVRQFQMDASLFLWGPLYASLYIALLLYLTILVFNKKNL